MKLAITLTVAILVAGAVVLERRPLINWFTMRPMDAGTSADRSPDRPGQAQVTAGPFQVSVRVSPGIFTQGGNQVTLVVRDEHGVITGARVSLEATMLAMGAMPEMHVAATIEDAGHGVYRGGLELPMRGDWMLRLSVQTVDARRGTASLQASIGSAISGGGTPPGGIAYYTCSMHPSVKSPTPGHCPICGMDLAPVTHADLDSGVIVVDAERRQLIGVTTSAILRKDTALEIRAEGVVRYAETRLRDITVRYPGWIGEVMANTLGFPVTAGTPLFTISSPDLLAAQSEYLQGLRQLPRDQALSDATRQRLVVWGMSPAQITELAHRGTVLPYLPILAPIDGVVVAKEVLPGGAVQAGQMAMRLADPSSVWVEAALYDQEQALVAVGMPAEVEVTAFPGDPWHGTVGFIAAQVDEQTRTTRIRVELPNQDRRLKPGMYATTHLRIPLRDRVVAPVDAVIHAGETTLVFLDLGEGKLKPQHVTAGVLTVDGVEITQGLNAGDVVVNKAAFLLAAESHLKSGTATW